MIRWIDFYIEWKTRLRMYWRYNKRIIVKNPGIIQWDDGCFIHRFGWQDRFTIEQMKEFGKEIKKVNHGR